MANDGRTYLTGKTRHRSEVTLSGRVVLVLQVEYAYYSNPITEWRDACVEDVTTPTTVVRT